MPGLYLVFSVVLWLSEIILFSYLLLFCLPCPTGMEVPLENEPVWHSQYLALCLAHGAQNIPAGWMNQYLTKRMAKLENKCVKERNTKSVVRRVIFTQEFERYRFPNLIFSYGKNIPSLLSVMYVHDYSKALDKFNLSDLS